MERPLLRSPILAVVGTRPEAIKMAPVVEALARRGLPPQVVLTGQHPLPDPESFGLSARSAIRLGCAPGPDPMAYAEQVAGAMTPLVREAEMVIVQGDTSSALGGALAGFAAQVPVAHVEAGLRSFDPQLPWPEEGNRVAIDARAELLFAPTETSAANLRSENAAGEIHVTGNTAIDALLAVVEDMPPVAPSPGTPRLLVTCHRRENWGAAFLPVSLALIEIAKSGLAEIQVILHPNPKSADAMRLLLGNVPGITLVSPFDHRGMVEAMRRSTIVLSDSGGVQEEAPALGVPLLILRDKTERPEAIHTGNMILAGTDTAPLVAEVTRLLTDRRALDRMRVPAFPYGDGRSGERIAEIIDQWLAVRQPERRTA